MKDWKKIYDPKVDVLWIGQSGEEDYYEELIPGVRVEFDKDNKVIGIEIIGVKKLLND